MRAVTEALCEVGFSATVVSELTQRPEAEIQAWRTRSLTQAYPYLIVDARYEQVRVNHPGQSGGVLIIKGIGEDGQREILSVELGPSENEATWAEVFKRLWERGLRGLVYVVSDEHQGLVAAIRRYFQGVIWQRCQVHDQRDAQKLVPPSERAALTGRWRDVFQAPDYQSARSRLHLVAGFYRSRYRRLADWLEETGEHTLGSFTCRWLIAMIHLACVLILYRLVATA